jgi:hypothetical protein
VVQLSWVIPAGATSVDVKILEDGNFLSTTNYPSPENEDTFEVPQGKTWCFFIRACNACGCSGWTGGETGLCSFCPTTTTTTTTLTAECQYMVDFINTPHSIGEAFAWNRYIHYIPCLGFDPETTSLWVDWNGVCWEIAPYPEDGPDSYSMTVVECESTTTGTTTAATTTTTTTTTAALQWKVTYVGGTACSGGICVDDLFSLGATVTSCPGGGADEYVFSLPSSAIAGDTFTEHLVTNCGSPGTHQIDFLAV